MSRGGRGQAPGGLDRNPALFVAFRVLFQARFYYPVLGVLFVDLGLSAAQYALLNAVWAATILTLEIPSGALADAIGRKRLVVAAAGLMVAEMAVLALAPPGAWLFPLLLANRVLSGVAEACASGADEALAYDSLPPDQRQSRWPAILAALLRWQSAMFAAVMLAGAALYDRNTLAWLAELAGWEFPFESTTRWPVLATLGVSFACLAVALAMREPPTAGIPRRHARQALQNLAAGARAVLGSRRILALLAAALLADSTARMFLTFASNYQRLIGLPEAAFGITGALLGLLGFIAAPLGRRLVRAGESTRNFAVILAILLAGFLLAAAMVPRWGVAALAPIGLALQLTGFLTSHYLNLWTDERVRATVLSFRGAVLNAGYGLAGLGVAALMSLEPCSPGAAVALALRWLPAPFAGAGAAWFLWAVHACANHTPRRQNF